VGPDGEPIAPEAAAKKFIRQSRCIIRDHIPIRLRLWKASNPSEERDAVPEREKEWCWRELKKNFTVPAEFEEICKRWTLSKMSEQLQSFKKILTKKYIKTGTTPVFTGELEISGVTGMHLWNTSLQSLGFRRGRRPKTTPRRKSTSHSRPRRLQACNTQMGEDVAGSA